jgi:hypothetical protein
MLQQEAITHIRDYIVGKVNRAVLGTSTTVASANDGGVIYPSSVTTSATTYNVSGNQITFTYTKLSTIGVSSIYSEYGFYDSVNNVDYTRYVMTPIQATGYEDWTIKSRLYLKSV